MRDISPEERSRRLGNVAQILIELGRKSREALEAEPGPVAEELQAAESGEAREAESEEAE